MSTTRAPFGFGNTVSGVRFTNREEEQSKLYNNLTQGVNTLVISPRRWGKSSLVEQVALNIQKKEKHTRVVVIDMFSCPTQEIFLEVFAREILRASSSKVEELTQTIKAMFRKLNPTINIGLADKIDLTLTFDWNEIIRHADEILSLPERIAKEKSINFIVCIDEFQHITSYKDFKALEHQMRSVWQRQKSTTYCLYGSKRHMMTEIFDSPTRPFYRFGDMMFLDKIKEEKWIKFIQASFKKTGKKISIDLARAIPRFMQNHSWYVQQLSHYTWSRCQNVCEADHLNKALRELIQANTPLYTREIEILSATQINLLKAIIQGETQLTSVKVMQTHRLGTPRNVAKNRMTLERSDIIHKTESGYELLDPAFEIWFRMFFFREALPQLQD